MRNLIFIHGRAQQSKDPVAIKKEWMDAWATGLAKSNLKVPISTFEVRFPYYGDTLDQLSKGVSTGSVPPVVVRGHRGTDERDHFLNSYLRAIAEKYMSGELAEEKVGCATRGILNWNITQKILSLIDRKIPYASAISVALFTRDVYDYLFNKDLAQTINQGVMEALYSEGENVVVSHSLGTVIAYRLLSQRAVSSWRVPLFVTLGSPLGVEVVRNALHPLNFPGCIQHWFNAMDDRDIVALWPLDKRNFLVSPAIENKVDVDNPTENRHGVSGYLCDREVALRIYKAVIGT